MKTFLLFLFCILGQKNTTILTDKVDLVEVNHYHDAKGKPVFKQLIFYNWSNQRKRFDVLAWRIIKSESQFPVRKKNNWIMRWHDDEHLREIFATNKRETWTQYDPELKERDFLSQDQRIGLKQNKTLETLETLEDF